MPHVSLRAAAVVMAMCAESACTGQTVSAPFSLSAAGEDCAEPVIQANPLNGNDVVAAWIHRVPPSLIQYVVTTNGFATWSPLRTLPLPNADAPTGCPACTFLGRAGDPTIGASRGDGSILLGALFPSTRLLDGARNAFGLARKVSGSGDFELLPNGDLRVRYAVPCDAPNDREWLAIGPRPPGQPSGESAYLTFDDCEIMRSARSKNIAPVGSAWELCPPGTAQSTGYPSPISSDSAQSGPPGKAVQAVVLPNTAGLAGGRLIAASRDTAVSSNAAEVTWSDTGGGPVIAGQPTPWQLAQLLDAYGPSNIPVVGITNSPASPPPVPIDVQGWFHSDVSIANDYRAGHGGDTVVLFNGRDPSAPNDIDLFLSWTDTSAEVPPAAPGPKFQSSVSLFGPRSKTHRIADSWLALRGEYNPSVRRLQQFMGRVVIDDLGGVNLWFMCARQPIEPTTDQTPCSARYARWKSIASLNAGDAPFLWVSPEFGPFGGSSGHDYIGLTTAGCLAYANWAEKDAVTGLFRIKCIKIVLPCQADVDGTGTIDASDTVAFGSAYIASQPLADVNQDSVISPQDVTDFVAAFNCGACPIP